MRLKIHTKGITGSQTRKEGEEAGALFAGLLELDGEVYDCVTDMTLKFGQDMFATVEVTFVPGDIEVVSHTQDSWEKIARESQWRAKRAVARRAAGQQIAVYVSPPPKDQTA